MLEERLAAISRTLETARVRRTLLPLAGALILGRAIGPDPAAPQVAAARKRKRHGKPGHEGPSGPAGGQGPTGAAGATGPQGPAGLGSCPADTIFLPAVGCVETTARSSVAFPQAVSTCGRAGRRLLTGTELMAVASNFESIVSLDLSRYEWSGSIVSDQYAIIAGWDDNGSLYPRNFSSPFRCMTVPAITSQSS